MRVVVVGIGDVEDVVAGRAAGCGWMGLVRWRPGRALVVE